MSRVLVKVAGKQKLPNLTLKIINKIKENFIMFQRGLAILFFGPQVITRKSS